VVEMAKIDSMSYWMDQLANRSESTKQHYLIYFKRFSDWMGKSPDQLIEMQKATRNQTGDPRENRVLEGKVKAFLKHLEDQGLSVATRGVVYAAVLSFFECNLHPLDMHPHDRPSGESQGSRIPEKKEVAKLLNAAKSRTYRAAILFLKDSGLRVSDAVRLRWDAKEDLGEGFWGWKILTKKRKVQATPFVGPETTEALKLLPHKDERIFPVSSKVLSNAISKIAGAADLKGISAHGLRKYFNVELQAARVPREWRYQIMGKKTSVYDENRQSKLFEAYREAYGNLRVYGADANAEMEKLKRSLEELRTENKEMRERLNGYALSGDQVAELLRRIEKLEKQAQKQN
jgi:integrase